MGGNQSTQTLEKVEEKIEDNTIDNLHKNIIKLSEDLIKEYKNNFLIIQIFFHFFYQKFISLVSSGGQVK